MWYDVLAKEYSCGMCKTKIISYAESVRWLRSNIKKALEDKGINERYLFDDEDDENPREDKI